MPKLAGVNHLNAVRALEEGGFRIARQDKHIVMTWPSIHKLSG